MNRRLKRTSNVLHAWERGNRHPSASDFLKLAALSSVDVRLALSEFGGVTSGDPARRATGVADWLRSLTRDRTHAELARGVCKDRNTVARWLRGETEPRLPDLLRLVSVASLRLEEFVAGFTDPEKLPSIAATYRDLRKQRQLAYELPWAHAVLRVLELRAYRDLPHHEAGFIARRLGIAIEEEERSLVALGLAGQIRRRAGKWTVRRVLAVDTRYQAERNLALKKHWAQVALHRLEGGAADKGALFSYNLFAISEEGLEEIRKAHLDYFTRLRAIVAACEDPTRLVLANVQLLPLDVG